MGIDWSAVVQTLTATTVIVAAIAWLAKTLFAHFLQRDLALTEARLQAIHDLNMSQLRAETERELVRLKALTDRELETLRIEADRALETHRAELTAAESKRLRITNEILDWSNPVLEAVDGLERCLGNILEDSAFCLLSEEPLCHLNRNWSISHDTFMPYAQFQFSRYFCIVGLVNEALSYELFESKQARDQFFSRITRVSRALSGFPHHDLPQMCSDWSDDEPVDVQMFGFEQASLGQGLRQASDPNETCLPYAEFLQRRHEPLFRQQLAPLGRFLDGLSPTSECRWARLQLMRRGLAELKDHWESLIEQSLAMQATLEAERTASSPAPNDRRS